MRATGRRKVQEALQDVTFGHRIAEEESDELASYFVETDQWQRIFRGDVDVVYGPKGSGKSAIYFLLLAKRQELRERGIVIVFAENARGTPAFKDLVSDPPTDEPEFLGLWKLYFLSLIASTLRELRVRNNEARQLCALMEDAGLLQPNASLSTLIRAVLEYARRALSPESLEARVQIDPGTGMPIVMGKITLREPTVQERDAGVVSADDLLRMANRALDAAGLNVWLALDRLDVAFAESQDLEQNALRSLFRVYVDFMDLRRISLKIFLRDDIWRRITSAGFREASHITRSVTITWDENSLLNLIIRRALRNREIRERYQVDPDRVLGSLERQKLLFNRIFPLQVDPGSRRPSTLDWMLSRTRDGTGETAPRELIHLLESTRGEQLRKLELGEDEPPDDRLLTGSAIKAGLPEVSKVRLEQTLYAEYPQCRDAISALDGQKTQQDVSSLAKIFGVSEQDAKSMASQLVDIGFFEQQGPMSAPSYWVPFLYREALHMIQGSAE